MALSRPLLVGKSATQLAAACGSVCTHWAATCCTAALLASPAGNVETKFAATCGEFRKKPETTPARKESCNSPAGKLCKHSWAAFGSLAAHELATLREKLFWAAPAGSLFLAKSKAA